MRKVRLYFLLISILSANYSLYAQDQDIGEFVVALTVETHCSINAEFNSKCFDLDENQCRDIYSKIFADCSPDPGGFPVSITDPAAETEFRNCVASEFESYLVSSGIDLDAPCQQ